MSGGQAARDWRCADTVRTPAAGVFAQVGIGPPHRRAKQVNQIDVDGWVMPAAARAPDAGIAFTAFLQEPANLLAFETGGLIPPRVSLATSAHVQQPYIKALQEMLNKHGRGYQQYQQPAIVAAVTEAVQGRKTPKQALDAARAVDHFISQLQPAPK